MSENEVASIYKSKILTMLAIVLFIVSSIFAETPQHGVRPAKLVVHNVIIVDGNGTPAAGPYDIFITANRITKVKASRSVKSDEIADAALIDGTGKYVLPGFINMHGHLQDDRAGIAMPFEYQQKLWLGAGITGVRDVGSDPQKALKQKRLSASGEIAAPRLWLYMWCNGGDNEQEIRANVQELKKLGADGLKFHQLDRETFRIAADEARKLGLKWAHHVGVEDTDAWDDAAFGTSTIEHWYGVPDAALKGVQNFPADFNYNDELHRFRYAGRLWREADHQKLQLVLQTLVEHNVAWDPTLCIYEASRDLQRATTQPWFREYLHPALEAFFAPNQEFHGSFFFGWTHADEVYWRENYRIWMQALHNFADMGGIITTGEDAGFIYQMYGFGFLRELQLHEEAGFHPLEVIQHATGNPAKVLGLDHELGRIKVGYLADLLVVNGNPLANLQILLPRGIDNTLDLQRGDQGGIEWTIKDGIPYHGPTLFGEVKALTQSARQEHKTD